MTCEGRGILSPVRLPVPPLQPSAGNFTSIATRITAAVSGPIALDIIGFEQPSLLRLASAQNVFDIDRRNIYVIQLPRPRKVPGHCRAAQGSPIYIDRNAIHPAAHRGGIPQLAAAFPTSRPGSLRGLESRVITDSARHQQTHRVGKSRAICKSYDALLVLLTRLD